MSRTIYRVNHVTRYRYEEPAALCVNQAHLTPRRTPAQEVVWSDLVIDPVPDDWSERLDVFGNRTSYFAIERPHAELTVTATCLVTRRPLEPGDAAQLGWEAARDAATGVDERDLVLETPSVPHLDELVRWAGESFGPGRPLLDVVTDLLGRIGATYAYDPHATSVSTPLDEVVHRRRGVCQDFAHLLLAALRSHGLPARYVSGYLETLPPPGEPKLVGADASHAWCAVRLADGSWLDLDPTNDQVAPLHHVTLAWGRDYRDVAPLQGVVLSASASAQLDVEVDVERIEGGRFAE